METKLSWTGAPNHGVNHLLGVDHIDYAIPIQVVNRKNDSQRFIDHQLRVYHSEGPISGGVTRGGTRAGLDDEERLTAEGQSSRSGRVAWIRSHGITSYTAAYS